MKSKLSKLLESKARLNKRIGKELLKARKKSLKKPKTTKKRNLR